MINIRQGMFETNSSSVHSLIIRKDDYFKNATDSHSYVIKGGYYGRSPQLPIETTEDKLNYIWTMVNNLWGLAFDNYVDEDGQWIPENKRTTHYENKQRFDNWKNQLQKMFPNTQFITVAAGDYNCSIDHVYELEKFADEVEKHPELLQYLLFSYSWISISGDEYANWEGILSYPYGELVEINNSTYIFIKGD